MSRWRRRSLLGDPRYIDFVERFQGDPLGFAIMVTGMEPSLDQENLFLSMTDPNAKVSVVSGTGTGKTAAFGRIALWHLLCHPVAYYDGKTEIGSNTYIGAPRIKQVSDGVWKEMSDCRLAISSGPYKWLNSYFEIRSKRVAIKGHEDTWFISQVAMQQGKSVGIAGKHRYWQLIIVDEAAGVSDEHFDVIDGTQTQAGNRTLLASQGVRNAGRFYDTHHSLSVINGGSWISLEFSSEHSPFVTDQWLRDREMETGGRQTVEYRIRVLGKFAEDTGSILLSGAEVDACFERGQIIADDEPFGILLLADVSLGEYRDDSVALVAKVIGYSDFGPDARRVEFIALPYCTNTKNEIDFSGDLVNLFGKYSNATLMVDNGGIGAAVNKLIEASGVPVVRVDWGKPCFKKEHRNRFYNQRACAMVLFRDAVRSGRVSFNFGIDRRTRTKIVQQGSRIPYHYVESGGLRYAIEKKEVMRKNGIKSPDIIDAASFSFLEDATYMVSEFAGNRVGGVSKAVMSKAESLFAELEIMEKDDVKAI